MGVNQLACLLPGVAFALCVVAGAHAYTRRKEEASAVVSPRKLLYLTYAIIFLLCAIWNFMLANVLFVFRWPASAGHQSEILTLTVIVSYLAAHAGVIGVGRGARKP